MVALPLVAALLLFLPGVTTTTPTLISTTIPANDIASANPPTARPQNASVQTGSANGTNNALLNVLGLKPGAGGSDMFPGMFKMIDDLMGNPKFMAGLGLLKLQHANATEEELTKAALEYMRDFGKQLDTGGNPATEKDGASGLVITATSVMMAVCVLVSASLN